MSVVTVDPAQVTTHLLINRNSACGTPAGEPANWKPGEFWVKIERGYLVTCPKCRKILAEVHAERHR